LALITALFDFMRVRIRESNHRQYRLGRIGDVSIGMPKHMHAINDKISNARQKTKRHC
jgi:hypothetical protein